MIIYGIKNCDTMQKAFKFLDKKKLKYTFHDYKEKGIDKETIKAWLKHFPINKVINLRSTTFKSLPSEDQASISNLNKAMKLIMENTSIVKRPLVDLGNGKMLIGFKETDWERDMKE